MSDLEELYDDLSDFAKPKVKQSQFSPREERVIAGFEDILRFYDEHGRAPLHGEQRDIFERLYAVRLDRLRALPECRDLLAPFDTVGLLEGGEIDEQASPDEFDLDALADELADSIDPEDDITQLRHVISREERRAADEIANREKCEDFEQFEPLFATVEADLKSGVRATRPFVKDAGFSKADITKGHFFIIGGQMAYVADVGDMIKAPNGEFDARLRVIFSNGTESNLLRRSMQRALYKDEAGRRVTEGSAGPLFGDTDAADGDETGTIYVLQSLSDHPMISANRQVIHKIGVTGGSVESRLAAADRSATYLLADVNCVAQFKLKNVDRRKLEALIHRIFAHARLDIELKDRFGRPFSPKEWFLVPLPAISEAVERIKDGSILSYRYELSEGRLVEAS